MGAFPPNQARTPQQGNSREPRGLFPAEPSPLCIFLKSSLSGKNPRGSCFLFRQASGGIFHMLGSGPFSTRSSFQRIIYFRAIFKSGSYPEPVQVASCRQHHHHVVPTVLNWEGGYLVSSWTDCNLIPVKRKCEMGPTLSLTGTGCTLGTLLPSHAPRSLTLSESPQELVDCT